MFICLTAWVIDSKAQVCEGEWHIQEDQAARGDWKRHESAFVELNGNFYLLGGRGNKEIAVYNPQSKIWSRTNTYLNNIHHFQAVAYNNKIYIIGGLTENFPAEDPLSHILIYDPEQNVVTQGAEIPLDRQRGSAGVVLYQDKFYIVGGNRNGHRAIMEDGSTPAHVSWFDCYDPVNDTWQILPDAPHARDHFQAIVSRDMLYLIGGRRSSQDIPEIGSAGDTEIAVDVFDFINNRWLDNTESPADLPTARAGASNALLGDELVVIGGETSDNLASLSRVEALDLVQGTWRRMSDLNTGRHGTQAIVFDGDIFLVAGSEQPGNDEITNQENFLEAYSCDGPLYRWQVKAQSFSTHLEGPAVTVGDKIYVFGGFVEGLAASDQCEYYDTSLDTWTTLPTMLNQVTHLGAVQMGNEIWLPGGFDQNEAALSCVQIFDLNSQTWRYGPELPEPFASNGVARLGNQIHIFGGLQEDRDTANTRHYYYDLDFPDLGWQSAAPFTQGRNHFSTVTQRGKIYAIGGATGHDLPPVPMDLPTLTVYDPVSDSWSSLADLPASRSHNDPGSFITPDGRIITLGGRSFFGVDNATAKLTMEEITIYDPLTDQWKEYGTQQSRRLAPFARLIGNDLYVGSGGERWNIPIREVKTTKLNFAEKKELGFTVKNNSFQLTRGETLDISALLWTLYGETSVTYDVQSGSEWLTLNSPPTTVISDGVPVYASIQTQNLSAGTYQAIIVANADGYTSASFQIHLEVSDPNQIISSAWLEAECAEVGANWVEESTADASEGGFVVYRGASNSINRAPEDIPENYVRFSFDLAEGGVYHLFARYKSLDHAQNSFWVRVNGGSWIKWWQGLNPSPDFLWAKIAATSFNLVSGNNTLDIAYREVGAQLDKIYLDIVDQKPNGIGEPGTNCTNPSPNLPPQVDVILNPQSEEGATISDLSLISASDSEDDVLSYNATGLPEGLSMEQSTGLVSGSLTASPGLYEVRVNVNDGNNPDVTVVVNWEITPINLAPQVSVVLNPSTEEGSTVNNLVIVNAQDNENDVLVYSAGGLPAGLAIDSLGGDVSGTLTASPGIYAVTVSVTDEKNPPVTANVNWEVTVRVTNQAPQISVLLTPQSQEGATISDLAIISASDNEDDILTYSATGLPEGLSMDPATGLISGTLTASPSTYEVLVSVTDNINPAVSETVNWEVSATPVNLAPQVNVVLNPQNEEGATVTDLAIVLATDNENDILTYNATGLPQGLSMDPATGLVNGTLTAGPGIYPVNVSVSDNINPAVSEAVSWAITAAPDNMAPQVNVVLNPQNEEGATVLELAIVSATDNENDVLNYTALDLPDGLVMDPLTGLVSGTLTASPGTYPVQVDVSDQVNPAVRVSLTWEVVPQPITEKFYISLEAECAQFGDNWTMVSDPKTSGGAYAEYFGGDSQNKKSQPLDVSSGGILRFPFELSHADNYEVYALLSAPDAGSDSYWIRFDETGPWHYVYCFQIIGKGFRWLKITSSTISSPVNLSAGSHVMEILYRENGTQIDKFILRRDGLAPQGLGEDAENACLSTNEAPVALAQSDINQGPAPLLVNLDASASTDDEEIVSYEWSWMEGAELRTAQGAQTQVSFPEGTYQVTLTVRDEQGLESQSSLLIISEGAMSTQPPVRINAGGQEMVAYGETFQADNYFSDNTKTFTIRDLSADILNTDYDALYQTERSSINDLETFTYNIPVINGSYRVRIHLAEIYWGAPTAGPGGANRRVFSASLEGQAMANLSDLDLNAVVGPVTALIVEQVVDVSDQSLDISFSATVNQAKVSAIEIIPNTSAQLSVVNHKSPHVDQVEEGIQVVRVYENPLVDGQLLYVELSSPYQGDIQFDIYSENGIHVGSGQKQLNRESVLNLDLSNLGLKMGVYYLYVQGVGVQNEAQRLIKN